MTIEHPGSPSVSASLLGELSSVGYALRRSCGARGLVDVLDALGRVIHVEDVVVQPGSAALVKSERGLSLHTDHHRAKWIAWLCLAQANEGGDSVLADARTAFRSLPPRQRDALTRVHLAEHSIFKGDMDSHPVVVDADGEPRIYYSYWLAAGEMQPQERAAFEAFTAAVAATPRTTLRLQPGDVLVIDNHRMLHGRSPIEGDAARHLRRYWLEPVAATATGS